MIQNSFTWQQRVILVWCPRRKGLWVERGQIVAAPIHWLPPALGARRRHYSIWHNSKLVLSRTRHGNIGNHFVLKQKKNRNLWALFWILNKNFSVFNARVSMVFQYQLLQYIYKHYRSFPLYAQSVRMIKGFLWYSRASGFTARSTASFLWRAPYENRKKDYGWSWYKN